MVFLIWIFLFLKLFYTLFIAYNSCFLFSNSIYFFLYCFTIRQAGVIVIQIRLLEQTSLYICTTDHLTFFSGFQYEQVFALNTINRVIIYLSSISFIIIITLLFFPIRNSLLSFFVYLLLSGFVSVYFTINVFLTMICLYITPRAFSIHLA